MRGMQARQFLALGRRQAILALTYVAAGLADPGARENIEPPLSDADSGLIFGQFANKSACF